MKLLCWYIMLRCLSVSSESIIMYKEPGNTVTLKCSSEKCPQPNTRYVAMYLYHELPKQEEVLYYYKMKSSPRDRYIGRIQAIGSFTNHSITISNLTVDDSGVYTCGYAKEATEVVKCNAYAVIVTEATSCHTCNERLLTTVEERCPPLALIVIAACIIAAISTLVTLIIILIIRPRVQQCKSSRRRTRNALPVSNENVYEIMTKNGFHPDAAPEELSPS